MVFRAEETFLLFLLHVVVSAILFTTTVYSGSDWPSGWYGLPQPKSHCPSKSEWWDNGWWYEDRILNNQSTARVPQYSHLKGTFNQNITQRYFCIKKRDNRLDIPWPNGQYCIYQRLLKPCPPGFFKGSIGWTNSKDVPNKNHHPGNLNIPSGVFASRTRLNYCCKVDGSKENGISLPIYRPFFLLAYGSSECQSVKWATTTQEYLRFSVQEKMTFQGIHPFVDDNYALRYCYYQSSNKTLTTPQGTISGYLNQTSVHQERYTAWHIIPKKSNRFQFLVQRFTRFAFHASNISSYLVVLYGHNEYAPSLGRFSSTQSPYGQSIMSTNQLFVVLHFGDRNGTYDFEFNYDIYSPPAKTLTTPQGTIAGYLNQTSVHQERYTAWHIIPETSLPFQLALRFTRFTFHASNNNSYLEVLDGHNEFAPSLARFSSTQSPLGRNITSSGNHLFVALSFGDRNGTYVLEANYHTYLPKITTTVMTTTLASSRVTSSSPYTLPSRVTSQPYTSSDNVTSSPTTAPGYLRYHGNEGKRKLLLSILLPIGGLVIVLLVLLVVLIRRRQRTRRRRYSRMDVNVYDSDHELEDDMDGYFEEIQLSPACRLLQLTSQPIEEPSIISSRASNDSLTSEHELFIRHQHEPLETESHNMEPSASTSEPNQYESDPDPFLSYYVLDNDLLANYNEETELKEAESIELTRLSKESQDEFVLQKSPQKDKNIEVTLC